MIDSSWNWIWHSQQLWENYAKVLINCVEAVTAISSIHRVVSFEELEYLNQFVVITDGTSLHRLIQDFQWNQLAHMLDGEAVESKCELIFVFLKIELSGCLSLNE